MNIPPKDIELFYKLHPALLQYVNERLNLLPQIKTPEDLRTSGMENIVLTREKLWEQPWLIDEFSLKNPAGFPKEECAVLAGWKHAVRGRFFILKHLEKYSVFLSETAPAKAYGVCSLIDPLSETYCNLPALVDAALIPLRGRIIYDGILLFYPTIFGSGFRFSLNETYREAKKTFGIITTLDDIF